MIKERLRNETIDNIPDDLKELKKKDNIEILQDFNKEKEKIRCDLDYNKNLKGIIINLIN